MSQSKKSRVFILGAGCSVECGYPLGTGLRTELNNWQIPGECPTIKRSVDETIKLLRRHPTVETLDQLDAAMLRETKGLMTAEMLTAKVATNALFLAREEQARQTGLKKYKEFFIHTLGGPRSKDALGKANCHVLTFNYDQLFEIAFLDFFRDFNINRDFLYGEEALNSGFNGECHIVGPTPGRFCFLKLHGSAGWRVSLDHGDRRNYCPFVPVKPMSLADIEKRFPNQWNPPYGSEPLIAFPTERQRSQEYSKTHGKSSDYSWAPYIDLVWKSAATILTAATEIRVIGYSFNPIDSRHMVSELLSKATCEKIVIQNTVDVRKNLESYKQLRGRLDWDQTSF